MILGLSEMSVCEDRHLFFACLTPLYFFLSHFLPYFCPISEYKNNNNK